MARTEREEEIYQEVMRERGSWSEIIYRVAKRCGMDTRALAPSEVLSKMANWILFAKSGFRYCCYCDRRTLDRPLSHLPGTQEESTVWLCSEHAKKLLERVRFHEEDAAERNFF